MVTYIQGEYKRWIQGKNNISGFHNIKLIQSKRQSLNLKKLLTKAEYGEVLSGILKCSDKRCECCNYLLINDH